MKPGYIQTEAGEIPEDWEVNFLGDLGRVIPLPLTNNKNTTTIPEIFKLPRITFWQSLKLLLICTILYQSQEEMVLYMAEAVLDPGILIEPAWKVSIVYGMPCAIYHQLPAAYYLASRFSGNFEQGVLQSLNGGGQNQARSILTGALIGAQVGLSDIPKRFLDGLDNAKALVSNCKS